MAYKNKGREAASVQDLVAPWVFRGVHGQSHEAWVGRGSTSVFIWFQLRMCVFSMGGVVPPLYACSSTTGFEP